MVTEPPPFLTPQVEGYSPSLTPLPSPDAGAHDPLRAIAALQREMMSLRQMAEVVRQFAQNDVLMSALTPTGLQIGSAAITDVAATLLTGDIAAARMQTNLPTAFNATTGYSAAAITTGDLPTGRMQTNVIAAVNASTGGGDFAKFNTGAINNGGGAATVGALTSSGALTHSGSTLGVLGATPVTQRTAEAVTNGFTATGTPNTFTNYTPSGTYFTDQQAIYDAIANIARKVEQLTTGARSYGLFGG